MHAVHSYKFTISPFTSLNNSQWRLERPVRYKIIEIMFPHTVRPSASKSTKSNHIPGPNRRCSSYIAARIPSPYNSDYAISHRECSERRVVELVWDGWEGWNVHTPRLQARGSAGWPVLQSYISTIYWFIEALLSLIKLRVLALDYKIESDYAIRVAGTNRQTDTFGTRCTVEPYWWQWRRQWNEQRNYQELCPRKCMHPRIQTTCSWIMIGLWSGIPV